MHPKIIRQIQEFPALQKFAATITCALKHEDLAFHRRIVQTPEHLRQYFESSFAEMMPWEASLEFGNPNTNNNRSLFSVPLRGSLSSDLSAAAGQ